MKRLNVMISDESKQIILDYQNEHNIKTLDETTDKFILDLSD